MPGTPPRLQSTTSLWLTVVFFSVIAGMVVCVPLLGAFREGQEWKRIGTLLTLGGFFGGAATAVGVAHLSELLRRGAWVPPGTVRHRVLVAAGLVTLVAASVAAFMLAGAWVLQRSGL